MLKKFAMLATMAALFVACGSSAETEMEAKGADMDVQAQEAMDKLEADMNAAEAAGIEAIDESVEAVDAAAVEAVEGIEKTAQ